jgi:hypothetical protein
LSNKAQISDENLFDPTVQKRGEISKQGQLSETFNVTKIASTNRSEANIEI